MTETEEKRGNIEKALNLRSRVKKKKPEFTRQENWRYKRLKQSWRRPRGLDNKMRRKIKGWPATVNVGYRGPKATRGLHPSGYEDVLVHNVKEVQEVDAETQAIRIAHTVGKRKRGKILVEARRREIEVLNFGELEKRVGGEESLPTEDFEEEIQESGPAEEEKDIEQREETKGEKVNDDKS